MVVFGIGVGGGELDELAEAEHSGLDEVDRGDLRTGEAVCEVAPPDWFRDLQHMYAVGHQAKQKGLAGPTPVGA